MSEEIPSFRPAPLAVGGHRQTLLGFWRRRKLSFRAPSEDLVVEVEPDVRLLLRASWQAGPREDRPALVIVHGLGGSDAATYTLATSAHAWARGFHVVRVNLRGAGDGEKLCPRLYNAGLDGDLIAALQAVADRAPRIAVVGFSLGANLTLLALGRSRDRVPAGVYAAAAVSPPVDLAACCTELEKPGNGFYQAFFMRMLRRAYQVRQRLRPDLYALGRERRLFTVRQFDEAITAPYGGYRDAAEYYERSSSGPYLASIRVPTLLLAAADDPMIPHDSIRRFVGEGPVQCEVVPTGGHVGFVGPTTAPGDFWAAERVVAFAESLRPS
jgi:predicted alpha/beta-fold hydrolase